MMCNLVKGRTARWPLLVLDLVFAVLSAPPCKRRRVGSPLKIPITPAFAPGHCCRWMFKGLLIHQQKVVRDLAAFMEPSLVTFPWRRTKGRGEQMSCILVKPLSGGKMQDPKPQR